MQSLARLSPACVSACGSTALVRAQFLRQLVPWSQHALQVTTCQLVLTAGAARLLQQQQHNCCTCLAHKQHRQQQWQAGQWPRHPGQSALLSKHAQHYQQLQLQHGFASLPCRLTEDTDTSKEYTAASGPAAANSRPNRGLASTGSISSSNSSSSNSSSSSSTDGGDGVDEDLLKRRRRSTSESRAALRRTTESRAAVEDVAVMSKSQLLRRKKAWLAEQCWERQLPHDGLKDDLVQRLLDWQTSDQGQAAAAEAVAAARAAMAALAAPKRTNTAGQQLDAAMVQRGDSNTTGADVQHEVGTAANQQMSMAASGSGNGTAQSRRRRQSADAVNNLDNNDSSSSNTLEQGLHKKSAVCEAAAPVLQQPPRNAAAAAAESVTALLRQLQEQPDNAVIVALTRNALEVYTRSFEANGCSSASEGLHWASPAVGTAARVVQGVATALTANSSPQSLAALAKACYSREVQSPLLAAAVAEAVAAVASQLGPQEVYGVLRLLVEHIDTATRDVSSGQDSTGVKAMMKGFRALAEGLIRYSTALHPRQLTEAVQLLADHRYDDPYGLWMIAREATERLKEFAPADVVILLDAIAGMHVADDALCENVAAVVGSSKESYSQQQLQAVEGALKTMGCSTRL